VSQIAFGVYLLLNGMANDNNQVINILQGHIDEVDEFLEVTLEDLSYSITDLESRIDHLRVPLANLQVFEEMLESRSYRVELLEGNEKLEHIIARSSAMIELWNKDVIAGKDCTESFTEWLSSLKESIWKNDNEDIVDIFHAMRGNGDGWLSAFIEMGSRVEDINKRVAELSGLTAEMEKKAGEVSRKTWVSFILFTSSRFS
jgi:prefoldin subunit 5